MNKIKYLIAVAIFVIATAFSACDSQKAEIIPIGEESAVIEMRGEERSNEVRKVTTGQNAAASQEVGSSSEDIEGSNVNSVAKQKLEHIYVYVCGAVEYPEVYELSSDARIVDAIKAAGGFAEDAAMEYLNLASRVSDGQKIYVPSYEEVEELLNSGVKFSDVAAGLSEAGTESGSISGVSSGVASGANSRMSASGMVNINNADATTLMTLPGVGESKANKIIAYREENGGFSCIEDIMLVGGIKEGLFNKVKDYICVE